jgi:hypothetical protein
MLAWITGMDWRTLLQGGKEIPTKSVYLFALSFHKELSLFGMHRMETPDWIGWGGSNGVKRKGRGNTVFILTSLYGIHTKS